MLIDGVYYIICDLIAIIYDLDEREIDDNESLKESSSTLSRSSLKKPVKEFEDDSIIESNIILKVRTLYSEDKTL